jgi:hypothetical protein
MFAIWSRLLNNPRPTPRAWRAPRSFDFIFAGSVFTHIADLDDAWLLELGRILSPGGRLYVTVMDNYTLELMYNPGTKEHGWDVSKRVRSMIGPMETERPTLRSDFAKIVLDRAPGPGEAGQALVFYSTDYLRQHWGNFFKVHSVTPEAYGFQTAILLERTARVP